MREWQPIETAPKDGTLIDLWAVYYDDREIDPIPYSRRFADCKWDERGDWILDGILKFQYAPTIKITHWMLPPKGPK